MDGTETPGWPPHTLPYAFLPFSNLKVGEVYLFTYYKPMNVSKGIPEFCELF
jgi:hypothetical protein